MVSSLKDPFWEGQQKWCPSLPSTGSGVFSEFQFTLMTARFDGLESIMGWVVVCGGKIESELLHDSIELSILMPPQLARAHTRPFSRSYYAHFWTKTLDYSRAQSSCPDAHTSFATNTAAANVYKDNGPTKILMKTILIKGWDVTEATLRNKH
ncbi:hypothetical protein B0H14DRAFT_3874389 [Mycena olivaceomarginata]|nr:hypothetical protein B0H14DRAFT_3874389 [Mycena olivaceomarginata]